MFGVAKKVTLKRVSAPYTLNYTPFLKLVHLECLLNIYKALVADTRLSLYLLSEIKQCSSDSSG